MRWRRVNLIDMRLLMAMPGNDQLGQAIADYADAEYADVAIGRFPDGESHVRLSADPSGADVHLLCTMKAPDAQFLSLAFAAQTARDLGARSVNLIAPYLAYMRQDIRFRPHEAIAARSFAGLLSQLFDGLVTVDPHLHRIASLAEIFSVPTRALSAAPLMGEWVKRSVTNPLIIGPDRESEQWARAVAEAAGAPYDILSKTRGGDGRVLIDAPDLSRWSGRKPVLIDDIASTGGTLMEAAAKLAAANFAKPICLVVHALCSAEAEARLRTMMDAFVSTDTVPHGSNAISVARLIADAIKAS
jgi:ribose-phosphate pyrophosphokinase